MKATKIGIYTIEPPELKKVYLQAADVAGVDKVFGSKPIEEIL